MSTCASCRHDVVTRFCGNCGAEQTNPLSTLAAHLRRQLKSAEKAVARHSYERAIRRAEKLRGWLAAVDGLAGGKR
jgi:hypothetical protein